MPVVDLWDWIAAQVGIDTAITKVERSICGQGIYDSEPAGNKKTDDLCLIATRLDPNCKQT